MIDCVCMCRASRPLPQGGGILSLRACPGLDANSDHVGVQFLRLVATAPRVCDHACTHVFECARLTAFPLPCRDVSPRVRPS